MAELKPGQAAPTFELSDQNDQPVRLADYRGQKVLLYFYPRANTPGCTKQACSVRDAKAELKTIGVAVLGISPDKPAEQQAFDKKYDLGFPLLSDPTHSVAYAYSTWGPKGPKEKQAFGIIRSSFLIDEEGKIIQAWYKVSPEETVAKAQEALGVSR